MGKFRAWLLHVKGRSTPVTIYEVAENIQDLSRHGCGKSVPQDVLNALFTLERLSDVQPNDFGLLEATSRIKSRKPSWLAPLLLTT